MTKYKVINIFIATVWLINGLICKVFNLVPRHEEIVATILGSTNTGLFTLAIGIAETGMAIWILSGYYSKLNAITQIVVIGTMNIMEFFLARDLLLWGGYNLLFAGLFITLIVYNQFYLKYRSLQKT